MNFSRVSFQPIQTGGDDVTGALRKLDLNFGSLASALGPVSAMNTGTVAGTVAAGDDPRLVWGGFRNVLINPSFDIWQRGMGPFSVGYTADRWLASNVGLSCISERIPMSLDVSTSRYAIRHTIASTQASNSYSVFQQCIEGAGTLAGRTVTVSFLASASVAGKRIGVNLEQYFGAGGSSASGVAGQSVSLDGTWRRYSLTFDLPSISGKVLGADHTDFLKLNIWLDAGSGFGPTSGYAGQQSGVVCLADVELKAGEGDTGYENRPLALELQLCQRYFEKSYGMDVRPGTPQAGGFLNEWTPGLASAVAFSRPVYFRVPKRVTPAITLYASVSGASGKISDGGAATDIVAAIYTATDSAFTWTSTMKSTNQINYGMHFTADAEL